MSSEQPPDPIRSLAEQLQRSIDLLLKLVADGKWSAVLIMSSAVFILFLAPGTGWAYGFLSKFLPENYPIIFTLILLSLLTLALLVKRFNLDQPLSRRRSIFLGLSIATIIFTFLASSLIKLGNAVSLPENDQLSWGEEYMIQPEGSECKVYMDEAASTYKRFDYKEAEKKYELYVKSCKKAAAEAQIYLGNARAMQTTNPIKIAVSVPISRRDGDSDSEEVLRGVAIAQNEWNTKNESKKILVAIADDGYGDGTGDCGINRDEGECQRAIYIAKKLVKQNDILGVIGHFSSDATQAASKFYEEAKLVAVSPTSTAIRKNSQCSEETFEALCLNAYIFRTAPNDLIEVRKLIPKISSEVKRVAIVYEGKSTYSLLFKEIFTKEFQDAQSADSIVNSQSKDNPCNFSRSRGFDADNCLNKSSEASTLLLVPTTKNASDLENLLDKNFDHLPRFKLLGADSMYQEQFIVQKIENSRKPKKSTEGMIVAVPWHRSDDSCEDMSNRIECKAAKLFTGFSNSKSKSSTYNPLEISWRTATSYDATQALLEGLKQTSNKKCSVKFFDISIVEKGKDCLRRELKNVLLDEDVDIKGVLGGGKVKFNDKGDRSSNEELGVIVEAQEGRFKKIDVSNN